MKKIKNTFFIGIGYLLGFASGSLVFGYKSFFFALAVLFLILIVFPVVMITLLGRIIMSDDLERLGDREKKNE